MPSPIVSGFRRFSRAEKAAFAKEKAAQDEYKAVTDKAEIKRLSTAYEKKIAEERRRLGL